jgi:predicted CopG family antitoxin
MTNKYTTIRVERKVLKDICKLKYFEKQPYHEVISKLYTKYKDNSDLKVFSRLQSKSLKNLWDDCNEI